MDADTGQRRGSRVNHTRTALGLGFALALVSGLSASMLQVPDAPTTIAFYGLEYGLPIPVARAACCVRHVHGRARRKEMND